MGWFNIGKDECQKNYKFGKTLGTGSFATVKLCTVVKLTETAKEKGLKKSDRVAIKVIKKESLTAEDAEALKVEVAVMEKANHDNIIKLYEVYDSDKYFYMVLELMAGGELFDRVVERVQYTENEARTAIYKVADALNYCHTTIGCAHRDLKPENLLYGSSDDDAELKVADFGLATMCKEEEFMKTACGTPGYVAPEILNQPPQYTEKVDIWSLGVIAYILMCGFPPFYDEDNNNAKLFAKIQACDFDFPEPYWDDVSDEGKAFISELLCLDPEKRLTAKQVMTHPYIVGKKKYGRRLSMCQENMKQFNARRKFKEAISKVHAKITVTAALGAFAKPPAK